MKSFDLEERTAEFGQEVIKLCRTIPQDAISKPIISQLVRSATSIGANYAEARAASSRKDFANKIYIARKETQESRHHLKMLGALAGSDRIKSLAQECQELILIFQKSTATLRNKLPSTELDT